MWFWYAGWAFFAVIAIVAIVLAISKSNFKKKAAKNSRIKNSSGKTGAQVAVDILQANGIYNVSVRRGKEGGDHFNPRKNEIQLSPSVYDSSSVYAEAVAAHEVGHAIQWAKKYIGIKIRDTLAGPVQIISKMGSMIMIFGALFTGIFFFMYASASAIDAWVGWMLFAGAMVVFSGCLFQFITLPVEFNASKRAVQQLNSLGFLQDVIEKRAVKETLRAAAMTYVVAFAIQAFYAVIIVASVMARRG